MFGRWRCLRSTSGPSRFSTFTDEFVILLWIVADDDEPGGPSGETSSA
jgi:hypothetical protein